MDSNQILSGDKDLQLLLVDGPKICPTNPPRWQRTAISKQESLAVARIARDDGSSSTNRSSDGYD